MRYLLLVKTPGKSYIHSESFHEQGAAKLAAEGILKELTDSVVTIYDRVHTDVRELCTGIVTGVTWHYK